MLLENFSQSLLGYNVKIDNNKQKFEECNITHHFV